MAKAAWGVKRICPNCGAKYYDMQKPSPVCPACNTEYNPELVLRSRRNRIVEEEAADVPLATAVVDEDGLAADVGDEDAIIADDDDLLADDLDDVGDDGLIEDASELDDDSR